MLWKSRQGGLVCHMHHCVPPPSESHPAWLGDHHSWRQRVPGGDFILGTGTEKYNIHVCKPLETSLEEEEEVWRCLACSFWRGGVNFGGLGFPLH